MIWRKRGTAILGETTFRGVARDIVLEREGRRRHLYIVGKTGTGKSTLLKQMATSDMAAGAGLAFIDPHGDAAVDLAVQVKEGRSQECVYLDCSSADPSWSFNVFAGVPSARRALAAESIVDVFKKLWTNDWGPRLEHVLRAVVWTLLENPGSSFDDIPVLLGDRERRKAMTQHLENDVVRRFWTEEFDRYSPAFRAVVTAPLLNKVGAFLMDPRVRGIVAAPESSFDLRRVMNEGGILIVNLSKGLLGENSANLLGSLLVSAISQAALERADIDPAMRRDFYLYIDEFQSFSTLNLALMFAELRKFRCNLIVAHQYFSQLQPEILDSVLANAGTLVSFRPSPDDAARLARALRRPDFTEDLLALGLFEFMARLSIAGQEPMALSGRVRIVGR